MKKKSRRFRTLAAAMVAVGLAAFAGLMPGGYAGFGAKTVYAGSYTVPDLMITEVTPDSRKEDGTSGTPDAFEFIELYNTTNAEIVLTDYRIIYETPTVYKWIITGDKRIPAKGTFLVWVKSVSTATLSGFNANYGTSLTSAQLFEVSASGMANTASRTISIAKPDDTKISTVQYDPADVAENIGIPYLYPTDGTKNMRKLTTDDSAASPGSVFAGQVPPAAWDNTAPSQPTGAAAVGGTGQVTLSWNAGSDADLAFYRVYVDGALYNTYRKEQTSVTVSGLTAEQDYTLEIAAVDTSNNASARSAVVGAPLSIALTQQSVVSPPSGSFPEYSRWFTVSEAGPYIPGLNENLVPQGMAYAPAQNWFLLSHYRDNGMSSMISVLNASTGQLVKSMTIYNADRTPFTGHSGGIAVSASNVWISTNGYLYRIPLQDVVQVPNRAKVYIADRFKTGTRSSFAMYSNGVIWSGEFYYPPDYPTDASHQLTARDGTTQQAWMTGFVLDPATDRLPAGKVVNDTTTVTPDRILSTPGKIQGATALNDGSIVLSQSYGRTNDSKIYYYENVLAQSAHTHVTVAGASVPVWFLDGVSLNGSLTALPLAEGIASYGDKLHVLFESGHPNYVTNGKYPTDKIWKTDILPKLLVTEVTPDSKKLDGTTGTPDAFEYIELYNNTNSAINLYNYRIVYETPTVYTWTITSNKTIAPHGTFIMWIKSVPEATLADFNQNYGTSLTSDRVFEVSASGMANASSRTISIAAPNNVKLSTLTYSPSDVAENVGIRYKHPVSGDILLRKLPPTGTATPGSVDADQVP